MSGLWALALIYAFAAVINNLYVQPYRRRKAFERGSTHSPGALSFGLNVSLPIFVVALLVRSFVVDVYFIPSESMEPTLKKGTRVFVDRLAYGVRSPLTGNSWIPNDQPARGDVFIFAYPREPRTTYVKRVLGIPGDTIRIEGDAIWLNERRVLPELMGPQELLSVRLGDVEYQMLNDPTIEAMTALSVVVPVGHFFALGDNFDHSEDSRTWGLVSESHLIGRIWE